MAETLINVVQDHARNRGSATALTMLRDGTQIVDSISYAELHRRSQAVAAALQARNLQGNRAILLYPAGIEFVCAFLGCLYSGVIAVPAPPPEPSRLKRSLPRLQGIVKDCDAAVILTEASTQLLKLNKSDWVDTAMEVIETDSVSSEAHSSWKPERVQPQDLAYLQYTSGSTSTPQGIEISHFNLLYHLGYLQQTSNYREQSVTITWMPNFHDWGLIEGLLEPIYNATPCFLMSPISFVRRPRNWLAAISQFGGTHSQGPTFAYAHCLRRISDEQSAGLDLRSWRAAGIAAEPINYSIMNGFYEKFREFGFAWDTFSPAFGLGEATLKVSCCGEGVAPTVLNLDADQLEQNRAVAATESSTNVRTVVSSGTAHGETILAIADPESARQLDEGQVGEIWVSDPAVAVGYWNKKEESEQIFRARLSNGEGSFLRTGDLGFLLDSQLYVAGRLKDLIIVRGSNHYPQDIEWTAQTAHEDLRGQTGAAFSIEQDETEKLIFLQELGRTGPLAEELNDLMAEIVAKVAEEHELEVFDFMFLKRGTIPKTASGKIRRRASKIAYLQGHFSPVARWRSPLHRAQNPGEFSEESSAQEATSRRPSERIVGEDRVQTTAEELIAWLREYAGSRINSQLMDQRRSVPPHIVLDFGNRGLFGLQVPKSYGGLELSYQSTTKILEQLAAIDVSLATLVFLSNTNGLRPIVNFGSKETKSQLLPGLAAGRQLAAFALSEPCAGSNIGAIETKAIRQGQNNWQITGDKRWNGSAWADVVTVIAREFDTNGESLGISAFLVRQGTSGVTIGEEALTLGLRGIVQNSLHLQQVNVNEQSRLGATGSGLEVVHDALSVGRVYTAAVCAGGMKRTVQLLARYAKARKISSGTLLNHPHTHFQLSEITAKIEFVEQFVHYLTSQLDAHQGEDNWNEIRPLLMMAAKVLATDFFNQTTAWSVQLLGGRGYMENNEAARLLRDAKSLSIGEGPNESLLSYLGQPKNVALLIQWLASLGSADVSNRLTEACEAIKTRCEHRQDLSQGQRRLWSEYLSGQISIHSVAAAIVTSACLPSEGNQRLIDWCQLRLEQTIRESTLLAESGTYMRPLASINDALDRFAVDIGDVQQRLPGEDQALDPLLRADQIVKNSDSSPSEHEKSNGIDNTTQRRRQLDKLLRERISLGDRDSLQDNT